VANIVSAENHQNMGMVDDNSNQNQVIQRSKTTTSNAFTQQKSEQNQSVQPRLKFDYNLP
jgi:hypothetical protein